VTNYLADLPFKKQERIAVVLKDIESDVTPTKNVFNITNRKKTASNLQGRALAKKISGVA